MKMRSFIILLLLGLSALLFGCDGGPTLPGIPGSGSDSTTPTTGGRYEAVVTGRSAVVSGSSNILSIECFVDGKFVGGSSRSSPTSSLSCVNNVMLSGGQHTFDLKTASQTSSPTTYKGIAIVAVVSPRVTKTLPEQTKSLATGEAFSWTFDIP